MTHRPVLFLALAGALAGAAAAGQTRISSEKIAGGVWAAPTPGGSNVGWFDVGGTVVAVDSGANDDVGRALLAEIEKTVGKKPRYLVLTHAHRDHTGGAGAFAAAGVQVVSAEKAAPAALALDAAKGGGEGPILLTVSERMLLVGRSTRGAEIDYLGPGHTQGDLVVVLPDAGVLFSGDLAVNSVLPFLRAADMDVDGWQKILSRLAALKVEKMVPGHGAIGPREGIADTAAYIARVNELATKMVIGGLPEALWEAQIRDPANEIKNVPLTPDHIANVKAVAQHLKARQGAAPAKTAAPSPPATPASKSGMP